MSEKPATYDHSKVYDSVSSTAERIEGKARDRSITIRAGYIGLCFQCERAHIFRAYRNNDPTIICNELSTPYQLMPLDIRECNRFAKVGEIDLWTLIKTTPVVDLSTPTIKVGFEPDKKVEENHG